MKLFGFALILLLSGNEAFAVSSDSLRGQVVCADGYKFLVVYSTKSSSSPTVTQITGQVSHTLRPQPIKCDGTERKLNR